MTRDEALVALLADLNADRLGLQQQVASLRAQVAKLTQEALDRESAVRSPEEQP